MAIESFRKDFFATRAVAPGREAPRHLGGEKESGSKFS
jgi:hypothetical protein